MNRLIFVLFFLEGEEKPPMNLPSSIYLVPPVHLSHYCPTLSCYQQMLLLLLLLCCLGEMGCVCV